MPDLSVIIVSWNTSDLLEQCLDTLREATCHLTIETIVVDNGSSDGTLEMLDRRLDLTRVIANPDNRGFATANNQGLDLVTAPFALLLNSDAFVDRETIDRALSAFETSPRAGLVGVRILNTDGSVQFASGRFPTLRDDLASSIGFDRIMQRQAATSGEVGAVDWVHGACMFARMFSARLVGGLDTRFFMYSEEIDWCYRFCQHGWDVLYDGGATVVHLGGASSSTNDLRRRGSLYRSRIGLRRRMSGPVASVVLWFGMLVGLSGRVAVRGALRLVTARPVGRQTPRGDLQLVLELLRTDPLARWAVS